MGKEWDYGLSCGLQKDMSTMSPRIGERDLLGEKMVFADIIKDLQMKRLSWIIKALNPVTSALIRVTQKNDTQRKRGGMWP